MKMYKRNMQIDIFMNWMMIQKKQFGHMKCQ